MQPVLSEAALDIAAVAALRAGKVDSLLADADGDGLPSPGDTLLYQVTIANKGSNAATGVSFSDAPGPNTTLVVGSVSSSTGTVTSGNGAGDDVVAVTVGSIAAGTGVTIRFQVTINGGLPPGVDAVSNQGVVSSNELPDLRTDDPDAPGMDNPTVTRLPGLARITAIKSVSDANGGNLEPGDVLIYVVSLRNQAGYDIHGGRFVDDIPAHTTLVAGSVSGPPGSIVVSESPSLEISNLNVPARGQVTITFRVQVDSPLPAGVTEVVNQGTVFYDSNGDGTNDSSQLTDGDTSQPGQQPTVVPVSVRLALEMQKSDLLWDDRDGDGQVSPDDVLEYEVLIVNSGSSAVTDARFSDTPDANTSLVTGSVRTTQGTITGGNGSGDTSVSINLGTIAGHGGSATIRFRVRIHDPLPGGVRWVTNQGMLTSPQIALRRSDDPDTPLLNDATLTVVGAVPVLEAGKSATLWVDGDGDGLPSAGDTLQYEITISSSGNAAATAVQFSDTPDPNTALVAGSVQISQGTVTRGNGAGDNGVDVMVGTLGAGDSVTIRFQVTIHDPLPAGVAQVTNQGLVRSTELPDVLTDDPETAASRDATVVNLVEPLVTISKAADKPYVQRGETLTWAITVHSRGGAPAEDVVVTDEISELLAQIQVNVSQGTASWNSGTRRVVAHLGRLEPGRAATIIISGRLLDIPGDELPLSIVNMATVAYRGAARPVRSNTVVSEVVDLAPGEIPEPATVALMGSGLLALAGYGRRQVRRRRGR